MRCPNCGAGMVIADRGDHLRCDFCESSHFPQENRDGVRSLDEPTGKTCPSCGGEMCASVIDRARLEICRRCEGILMQRRDFVDVVQVRRALWNGPKIPARPLEQEEGRRKIKCPTCGEEMECHPYHGPGHVWIDTCAECNNVWLDRGELTKIERS